MTQGTSSVGSELQRVRDAAAIVREYQGSEGTQAFVALLSALEAMYLQELRTVAPDGLVRKQAAIAQCEQLTRVLRGTAHVDGRI